MQAINAELGFHRLTQAPAQDLPAVQINDGGKVDHPSVKLDVGDIRCPDLVDICNGLSPEQIRVLLEFPLGYSLHVVTPKGELTQAELKLFLENKGLKGIEIKPAKASVEDVFMLFIQGEK